MFTFKVPINTSFVKDLSIALEEIFNKIAFVDVTTSIEKLTFSMFLITPILHNLHHIANVLEQLNIRLFHTFIVVIQYPIHHGVIYKISF